MGMDWGALAGVVLGAVLAMAAGIATELWKQRRVHRATARLLWFDLLRNWSVLFGVVASERWPEPLRIFVQTWQSVGDKLALGSSPKDLLQLQGIFGAMEDLHASDSRPDHASLLGMVAEVEVALRTLGAEAGLKQDQVSIDFLDRPLVDRVSAARLVKEEFPRLPDDIKTALADPSQAATAFDRLPDDLRKALTVLEGGPGGHSVG